MDAEEARPEVEGGQWSTRGPPSPEIVALPLWPKRLWSSLRPSRLCATSTCSAAAAAAVTRRRRARSVAEVMSGMAMIAAMIKMMPMTQHIFLRTCHKRKLSEEKC